MGNYAFIDSQNVHLSILSQGWKLDWHKFRIYLRDKFNVTKAFVFVGYVESNQNLYRYLESTGYELIFKPTTIDADGKLKGNIDAELVLHSAAIEYKNYSQAIVASGDGDYYCLYKFLIENNKLRKILIPNKRSESSLLKEFQFYKVFLEREKEKIKTGGVAL